MPEKGQKFHSRDKTPKSESTGCASAINYSIVTMWYCDTTRPSDILTKQEHSLAKPTRPLPFHAYEKG